MGSPVPTVTTGSSWLPKPATACPGGTRHGAGAGAGVPGEQAGARLVGRRSRVPSSISPPAARALPCRARGERLLFGRWRRSVSSSCRRHHRSKEQPTLFVSACPACVVPHLEAARRSLMGGARYARRFLPAREYRRCRPDPCSPSATVRQLVAAPGLVLRHFGAGFRGAAPAAGYARVPRPRKGISPAAAPVLQPRGPQNSWIGHLRIRQRPWLIGAGWPHDAWRGAPARSAACGVRNPGFADLRRHRQ